MLHQKCEEAYKCPFGSNTVPGTCGRNTCRKNELISRAQKGDFCASQKLRDRGIVL